jgi:hypothetical protein
MLDIVGSLLACLAAETTLNGLQTSAGRSPFVFIV